MMGVTPSPIKLYNIKPLMIIIIVIIIRSNIESLTHSLKRKIDAELKSGEARRHKISSIAVYLQVKVISERQKK